jgi:hypothetical protein
LVDALLGLLLFHDSITILALNEEGAQIGGESVRGENALIEEIVKEELRGAGGGVPAGVQDFSSLIKLC